MGPASCDAHAADVDGQRLADLLAALALDAVAVAHPAVDPRQERRREAALADDARVLARQPSDEDTADRPLLAVTAGRQSERGRHDRVAIAIAIHDLRG